MSRDRPSTREVFEQGLPDGAGRDAIEREFYARVKLPNGAFKTTSSNRLDDVNRVFRPYLAEFPERPLSIMDVAVSSGVSTVEWFEYLERENLDCRITATDRAIYVSLLSLTRHLEALVDREGTSSTWTSSVAAPRPTRQDWPGCSPRRCGCFFARPCGWTGIYRRSTGCRGNLPAETCLGVAQQ